MRYSDPYVKQRWSRWFAAQQLAAAERLSIRPYAIGKALGATPYRMKRWRTGLLGVGAVGAWLYGQRLSKLRVPLTSGPVALHACGYVCEAMEVLRELAADPTTQDLAGARYAVTLWACLPTLNAWLDQDPETVTAPVPSRPTRSSADPRRDPSVHAGSLLQAPPSSTSHRELERQTVPQPLVDILQSEDYAMRCDRAWERAIDRTSLKALRVERTLQEPRFDSTNLANGAIYASRSILSNTRWVADVGPSRARALAWMYMAPWATSADGATAADLQRQFHAELTASPASSAPFDDDIPDADRSKSDAHQASTSPRYEHFRVGQ